MFSESWSPDQLMQKAYWERMVIFQTQFHRPLHSSGTTLFKQIQMCEIFITFETLSFSLNVPEFNFKVTSNVAYILKLGKKTQLLTGPWQAIPVFQQALSLIFPLLPWVLCSLTTSFKKINNFTCMLKKQCI